MLTRWICPKCKLEETFDFHCHPSKVGNYCPDCDIELEWKIIRKNYYKRKFNPSRRTN